MNRRKVTVVQPGKIVLPAFAAAFDYIEDWPPSTLYNQSSGKRPER
jgi:hypothetical protein